MLATPHEVLKRQARPIAAGERLNGLMAAIATAVRTP
jgi:hypothetical protein